jgi:outer membrane protein assembly factor BamE (lipoprotein component of BamABCDE complex)
MRMHSLVALAAALCTAVGGCSTPSTGRDFDDAYVAKLQRGATTKAQVRQAFGEPLSVAQHAEGETWTWSFQSGGSYGNMVASAYGLASQQVKSKILNITFAGEKVKDFNYSNQK